MNHIYLGSRAEASIPLGLSGTVTLNWHGTNTEELSISPSSIYSFSPSSHRQLPSLAPRLGAASPSSSSTIPSLLGSSNSTTTSNTLYSMNSRSLPSQPSSEAQLETMASPNLQSIRSRSRSRDDDNWSPPLSPVMRRGRSLKDKKKYRSEDEIQNSLCRELSKTARKENDAMVYLDGPRVYTCGECRTHLTSHDEIISKSFHGRHGKCSFSRVLLIPSNSNSRTAQIFIFPHLGRAYLFDMCVNITTGPSEDRRLITGLHSVSDISCKRCKTVIGWTYAKAYEPSQKYKEGKFIIEKIHLHMEESDSYQVHKPAGERKDRWKMRSLSWGDESASTRSRNGDECHSTIYEYRPRARTSSSSGSWTLSPNSHGGRSHETLHTPRLTGGSFPPPSPAL